MRTTEKPNQQTFSLDGVRHIEPYHAANAIANHNALIVDIRENEELDIIKFDSTEVIHLPMSVIAERFGELPKDRPLIIACNNGVRSVKVVNLLNVQGYSNATNLDGGIVYWHKEGLPLILRQDILGENGHCGSNASSGGCSGCGCH